MSDPPKTSRRRRMLRILCIAAATIGLLAAVAYFVIVARVRSELAAAVRKNFDGELRDASISYRPPFGVVVRHARIVRGDGHGGQSEWFRVERVDLRLAGVPRRGKPLIVESISLQGPALHVVRGEREIASPAVANPSAAAPAGADGPTLSSQFQIRRLRVTGGSLDVIDRSRPDLPPLAVGNVELELKPPPQPGAAQAFDVSIREHQTALHAAGSIDLDSRVLRVAELALDVKLGGAAEQGPLPPQAVAIIRRFGLSGGVKVRARGQVPLRVPAEASYEGTVEVRDVAVAVPGSAVTVDKINLDILCDSQTPPPPSATVPAGAAAAAGPAVHVRLSACGANCETGGGSESTLTLSAGEFWQYPARGTWKLSGVTGRVAAVPDDDASRPRAPSGAATRLADAYHLRGQVDFTAAASGPIDMPGGPAALAAVRYEILAFPRDAAFRPASFPLPLEHIGGGGAIRVAGDAVTFQDITATYGGDRIELMTARIPIPRDLPDLWQLDTRIEGVNGVLTCFQPGPVYPRGVREEFAALRPEGTFAIGNGRWTLNHGGKPGLARPGARPPKDDYSMDISADGGAAFSMTDRRLPLTHLTGKASLDSTLIDVGPIEARSMGGTVTVAMKITPGQPEVPALPGEPARPRLAALFQGEAWARETDLGLLAQALDLHGEAASRLSGRAFAHAKFDVAGAGGPKPPMDTLRLDGEAEILNCDFWEDPIVGKIVGDVRSQSGKHPAASRGAAPPATRAGGGGGGGEGAGDAAGVVSIADRVIHIVDAAINSPSIGVECQGTVGFDKRLDLAVVATPLGDLRDKIKQSPVPVLGDVAGELVGAVQKLFKTAAGTLLYQYRVTGTIDHPEHTVVPAPVLTDGAALLFGRMLQGEKDGPLLDSVKANAKAEAQRRKGP